MAAPYRLAAPRPFVAAFLGVGLLCHLLGAWSAVEHQWIDAVCAEVVAMLGTVAGLRLSLLPIVQVVGRRLLWLPSPWSRARVAALDDVTGIERHPRELRLLLRSGERVRIRTSGLPAAEVQRLEGLVSLRGG